MRPAYPDRAGCYPTADRIGRVNDADRAARHDASAAWHDRAAARHAEAAAFWTDRGDARRAALEQRNHRIELDAAELERDRAALDREDPIGGD